jgi:hypothetical protein
VLRFALGKPTNQKLKNLCAMVKIARLPFLAMVALDLVTIKNDVKRARFCTVSLLSTIWRVSVSCYLANKEQKTAVFFG